MTATETSTGPAGRRRCAGFGLRPAGLSGEAARAGAWQRAGLAMTRAGLLSQAAVRPKSWRWAGVGMRPAGLSGEAAAEIGRRAGLGMARAALLHRPAAPTKPWRRIGFGPITAALLPKIEAPPAKARPCAGRVRLLGGAMGSPLSHEFAGGAA